MAKDSVKDEATTPAAPAQAAPVQQPVDTENLQPIYTNFARVTGSPEELVLDCGLNPNPFVDPSVLETDVNKRVVPQQAR